MLVEVLVFRREERVDHELWHRLDRQIEAPLLGILTEQRTVGRMHARHHRRLVILKLGVVGQVLGEMPDRARDTGHADQEHDGAGSEQETQKPDQQAHCRISVPTCAPISAASTLTRQSRQTSCRYAVEQYQRSGGQYRFRRPAVGFLYRCRCGQTRAWATGRHAFQPALTPCVRTFHLPGPAVASRLAKNASIACAIDPTVRFRQFSDTRCSRSPLFET